MGETQIKGTDDFGRYHLKQGNCSYCGRETLCVVYDHVSIDVKNVTFDTAMFDLEKDQLGILCGHYSRFHRQVAHVADNVTRSLFRSVA